MNEDKIHKNKKNSSMALIITGCIIALALIGFLTNGFGLLNNNSEQLEIGNAPVLGNIDAPVTIFEFTDFSCPFCAAAAGKNPLLETQLRMGNPNWQAPIPLIKEKYINTGKVKLVFKYSPGHGEGIAAQLVAWCLNDQNLFWEFHDEAFALYNQTNDLEKMKSLAIAIGANINELNKCLNEKKYNYLLKEDEEIAKTNGVEGTPTFFINGKKIEGAASFREFEKVIESKL